MKRMAKIVAAISAATVAPIAGLLVSCLDDPRANDPVTVIDSCDTARLSKAPTSVESTLAAYVAASQELLTTAKSADSAMRDACLAFYQEAALGITAPTGDGSASACQPLLARISTLVNQQPVAPGLNVVPPWVYLRSDNRCTATPGVRETCLAACTGTCDVSKCEPNKQAGKCTGDCNGTCTVTAPEGVACHGTCIGEAAIPNTGGANPGATCQGECLGTCGGAVYTGNCEGACATNFTGRCGGTCHGTCNGTPLPVADAGAPTDAGTDAEAGAAGPPSTDPPQPSNNSPGNCGTGICHGSCSDHADGTCFSRCIDYGHDGGVTTTTLAPFNAGQCTDSVCVGACRSALGTGAAIATGAVIGEGSCKGECTELTNPRPPLKANTACDGTCRPAPGADGGAFCAGTLDPTTTICEGALGCNQNAECANACEAKSALEANCADPVVLQAFAVADPDLYAAFQKHGIQLGKASSLVQKAQAAFSYIGDRKYGDFAALGAKGDLARACVTAGTTNTTAASTLLATLLASDPTSVRYAK